eukprot:4625111-Amphidinium_carterae.1
MQRASDMTSDITDTLQGSHTAGASEGVGAGPMPGSSHRWLLHWRTARDEWSRSERRRTRVLKKLSHVCDDEYKTCLQEFWMARSFE